MYKYAFAAFLCCFLSLIAITSNAQKFNVKWGETKKLKFDFDDAVPVSNSNFMVLRLEMKGGKFGSVVRSTAFAVLVDKEMSTIIEKEIEIVEKNSIVKGFNKYGNNVFFIYSSYDKSNKTTTLYAIKLDDKTLDPISKTTIGSFESDKENDQADATYKLSSDSTKVLLMVKGPRRKKETEKLFLAVFDIDLKKLWSKQIDLGIDQKFVKIHDVDVSNDGKIYLALKHYENETSKETVKDEEGNKVPSYVYKMYVFEDGTAKEKIIRMDFQGLFVQGTRLINNKEGLVTVAGLYKQKHNGRITGVFYGIIDNKTAEIKNPKIVEFPTSLLELIDKDGFGSTKEKDPGLSMNFLMRHILYRDNGSVDLICEYYKLDVTTSYNSQTGSSRTYYTYYFGDIVNTNINQNGEVTFTRVPKNQRFLNYSGYLGFTPIIYNDKLVLLYNDDKDNVDRDLEKKPDDVSNFKKSVFVAATIDMKGNLSRQAIYNHKEEEFITSPREIRRIDVNKYLLTADIIKAFKKRTRFGLLEVK